MRNINDFNNEIALLRAQLERTQQENYQLRSELMKRNQTIRELLDALQVATQNFGHLKYHHSLPASDKNNAGVIVDSKKNLAFVKTQIRETSVDWSVVVPKDIQKPSFSFAAAKIDDNAKNPVLDLSNGKITWESAPVLLRQ